MLSKTKQRTEKHSHLKYPLLLTGMAQSIVQIYFVYHETDCDSPCGGVTSPCKLNLTIF
jgi:hypothetical protein